MSAAFTAGTNKAPGPPRGGIPAAYGIDVWCIGQANDSSVLNWFDKDIKNGQEVFCRNRIECLSRRGIVALETARWNVQC